MSTRSTNKYGCSYPIGRFVLAMTPNIHLMLQLITFDDLASQRLPVPRWLWRARRVIAAATFVTSLWVELGSSQYAIN